MADAEKAPAHPEPTLPSAKTPGDSKGEPKPIKPSQVSSLAKLPAEVKTALSKTDELILRINKLIKTTGGLGAALSTLNYSLYVAAYLQTQTPSRAVLIAYISRLVGRTPSKIPSELLTPVPGVSPIATLAGLVSETRTTLRLTGLIPLYVWLKTLIAQRGSKDVDPVQHRIAMLQCVAYITYQVIENTYVLVGKGIIPASVVTNRGGVSKWVMWSCRAWLVGVSSDFLRLWRESVLLRERKARGETITAQEQQKIDRKWWREFRTAASWFPMAVHYSLESGLPGMNSGLVGLSGLMAGLNNFQNAWDATAF